MNTFCKALVGFLAFFFVFFVCFVVDLPAADWPQWLGPNRDGVSSETGLLKTWPAKDGPPVVWQRDVGEGFSGPVVAGDRLILFHRVDNKEVVDCLSASKGDLLWSFSYATMYVDALSKGNGPRATPVIQGKRVHTLGAEGWLHCLDLENGKKIWGRSLLTDYKVPRSYFGVGTSPLIEGDLVLVNVGGKNAGIVAFHKDDGKEVWKATGDGASYSPLVAATLHGTRYAIFFTRQGVLLLDPANGKVVYEKRWRARYDASVNAATPLVIGDLLFFSASYETGALLLRRGPKSVEEVWSGEEILSNHFNTSVYYDGYLYGMDGRQDHGPALHGPAFRCVALKTGKVQWTQERFGCGSLVLAEGHVFILTEAGDLVLVQLSPQGYQEKARSSVFNTPPCRAQIALANGMLYARDDARLVCWNVKK
jgi:outer membrane protein assembly factor BamB